MQELRLEAPLPPYTRKDRIIPPEFVVPGAHP